MLKKTYYELAVLGMKNEFWKQVLMRALAAAIFCFVALASGRNLAVISIAMFWAFSIRHHFLVEHEVYLLKAKYIHCGMTPEEALQYYQVELCFLNHEHTRERYVFGALLALTLLAACCNNFWLTILAALGCTAGGFYEASIFKEKERSE